MSDLNICDSALIPVTGAGGVQWVFDPWCPLTVAWSFAPTHEQGEVIARPGQQTRDSSILHHPHRILSPMRSAGLNCSWARAAFSASYVAEYRRTMAGVLWPRRCCTSNSRAPFSMAQVAKVWRKR